MALDTRPNLDCTKFEQCSSDILPLSGTTNIYGTFSVQSGATLNILSNAASGKVLTSDASGGAAWQTLSIPAGEKITKEISQTSHGFSVGDFIGWSGGTYNKAIADGAYNGEFVGLVTEVPDVNTFSLTQAGYVSGLNSLVANTTYFLSPVTAGLLIDNEPSTDGQVSKAVLIANTTTSGWVLPYPGSVISSGATVISTADNGLTDNSGVIELGGALCRNTTISALDTYDLEITGGLMKYTDDYSSGIGPRDIPDAAWVTGNTGGGSLNMSGNTINGLTTYVDPTTICSQPNLTYDGSSLVIGVSGDGTCVLKLNIERGWAFQQEGTGATTALRLRSLATNKSFHIDTDATFSVRNYSGDTTTLLVDNSNGYVGIGTDLPSSALHIKATNTDSTGGIRLENYNNTSYAAYLQSSVTNAGILSLLDDGTSKISIRADGDSYFNAGNVGIGTTAPTEILEIAEANAGGDTALVIKNNDGTDGNTASILFRATTGAGDAARIRTERVNVSNSKMYLGTLQSGILTDTLVVDNTGNVGIGLTNPLAKVTVRGGTSSTAYLNGFAVYDSTGSAIRSSLSVNNSDDGQINLYNSFTGIGALIKAAGDSYFNAGNVGIGITSPAEKLDVVGKTKTTTLQVTTGAASGCVLTSDASGNATWSTPSNGVTNLSIGSNTATVVRVDSSTGNNVTLPNASSTLAGVVINGTQTFGGAKTTTIWCGTTCVRGAVLCSTGNINATGVITGSNLSGTNTGDQATNLSIGSNTATVVRVDSSTGDNVILPHATATLAGVVFNGDQTFGGAKATSIWCGTTCVRSAFLYSTGDITASGQIFTNTYFRSTDNIAVLGTASAGEVYLRPSNAGNTTAQSTFTTTLATIGTPLNVNGDITIDNSVTMEYNATSKTLDFIFA